LVCSKCGKRLKAIGVDYAKPGVFFKCGKCKALLPEVESSFMCFRCGASSTRDQLQELQLMAYNVNQERVSEYIVKNNFLPYVAEELGKRNVRVESPGKVKGLSKVQHNFDLLISQDQSDEPIMLADILEDVDNRQLNSVRILAFYAKCLDANFSTRKVIKKILLSSSELDNEACELAAAYGITILQSEKPEDIASTISDMLGSP
jgi:hypothetical protein